jgi:hypothetical protein
VAANVIDRCVYVVMLLLLAAAIFTTHANRRLRTKEGSPQGREGGGSFLQPARDALGGVGTGE